MLNSTVWMTSAKVFFASFGEDACEQLLAASPVELDLDERKTFFKFSDQGIGLS
jgi:hypothetical protein